jgi:hypothetical protein
MQGKLPICPTSPRILERILPGAGCPGLFRRQCDGLFDRSCHMVYNTVALCSRRSDSRSSTPRCPASSPSVGPGPRTGQGSICLPAFRTGHLGCAAVRSGSGKPILCTYLAAPQRGAGVQCRKQGSSTPSWKGTGRRRAFLCPGCRAEQLIEEWCVNGCRIPSGRRTDPC